jgi:hypothetical protein
MPRESKYFELPYDVECVHETPKAIKLEYLDGGKVKELWCPKGVIHDDSDVSEMGDEGRLKVFTNFAEENSWDDL